MKGRRPDPKSAPKSKSAVGDPPDWLPASAQSEWIRVIGVLAEMGSEISALHHAPLLGYCLMFAKLESTSKEIARDGETVQSATGELRRHPASVTQSQAMNQLRHYAAELGLTPGSAGKIPKPAETKKSKYDNL